MSEYHNPPVGPDISAGASHRSEDYGLSETNPIVTGPDTILYDLSRVETGTRYGGWRQRWSAYFAVPVGGNAQLLADARKAMCSALYLRRGRPVTGRFGYLPSGKMPSWYEVDGPANPNDLDAGPARMVEMRAYADCRHTPEIVDAQGHPITDLDTIFTDRRTGRSRRPLYARVSFIYEPYWGHGGQNVSRRLLKVRIFGVYPSETIIVRSN